jgi:hypothetical protein
VHSRDLEVAALSIQTRRLVEEATALVKSLRKHEEDLADFITEAREDFGGSDGKR